MAVENKPLSREQVTEGTPGDFGRTLGNAFLRSGFAKLGGGMAKAYDNPELQKTYNEIGNETVDMLQKRWWRTEADNFRSLTGQRAKQELQAAQERYNNSTRVVTRQQQFEDPEKGPQIVESKGFLPVGPDGVIDENSPLIEYGSMESFQHLGKANEEFYKRVGDISMSFMDEASQFPDNPYIANQAKALVDHMTQAARVSVTGRKEANEQLASYEDVLTKRLQRENIMSQMLSREDETKRTQEQSQGKASIARDFYNKNPNEIPEGLNLENDNEVYAAYHQNQLAKQRAKQSGSRSTNKSFTGLEFNEKTPTNTVLQAMGGDSRSIAYKRDKRNTYATKYTQEAQKELTQEQPKLMRQLQKLLNQNPNAQEFNIEGKTRTRKQVEEAVARIQDEQDKMEFQQGYLDEQISRYVNLKYGERIEQQINRDLLHYELVQNPSLNAEVTRKYGDEAMRKGLPLIDVWMESEYGGAPAVRGVLVPQNNSSGMPKDAPSRGLIEPPEAPITEAFESGGLLQSDLDINPKDVIYQGEVGDQGGGFKPSKPAVLPSKKLIGGYNNPPDIEGGISRGGKYSREEKVKIKDWKKLADIRDTVDKLKSVREREESQEDYESKLKPRTKGAKTKKEGRARSSQLVDKLEKLITEVIQNENFSYQDEMKYIFSELGLYGEGLDIK